MRLPHRDQCRADGEVVSACLLSRVDMRKDFKTCFFAQSLLVLIVFSLLLGGCENRRPVKVGFLGVLTGRSGDIGKAGRDGALLAVEEINASGGIDGRQVELIVRDDKLAPETCRKAVEELIDEQVAAIVGPMTSAMAMVAVPLINSHAIPTVSPTVSTVQLAGEDDYFFRVIPVSINAAKIAAEYLHTDKQCQSIEVVYDEGNRAYTEPWYLTLKDHFLRFPDTRVEASPYISRNGYDFLAMANGIVDRNSDCLVILASALDTALISQQFRRLATDTPIFASEWSLTKDLLEYGGKAVNGLELFHSFNRNSTTESYIQFERRFLERFGYAANFASSYGYNAMKIILDALEDGDSPEQIKRSIIAGSPYEGVQSQIRLDAFGDAKRDYTLLRIADGKVRTIQDHAQK